jgi:hypothetical protein
MFCWLYGHGNGGSILQCRAGHVLNILTYVFTATTFIYGGIPVIFITISSHQCMIIQCRKTWFVDYSFLCIKYFALSTPTGLQFLQSFAILKVPVH